MTSFIYDGTTLPDGKSNNRPISAPANKSLTGDEWNLLCQSLYDARTAILSGDYFGLTSNPSATISSSVGIKLRNNAGVFQVSENAGSYRSFAGHGEIHVRDYGAVGDGVADDTAALQSAFAAATTGQLVLLEAGKTYNVTEAIRLGDGANMFLRLDGRGATIQRTGSPLANWGAGVAYNVGDRVIRSVGQRAFEGAFECIKAGTSTTDAALGPKGTTNGLPWLASTAYTLGTERANAGKVYIVTTAGTSAASGGPTGTGSGIVDGTVVWALGGIPDETPWTGNDYYDLVGVRRSNGANLYEVTTPGFSAASGGPTGTGTGIVDGSVVWSYVAAKTSGVVWKSISDSVLEISTSTATVKDLHLGAGRLASYGVWLRDATQTFLENVDSYQALFDGFKPYMGSDFIVMFNCQARLSGRIWHTSGYAGGATASLKTAVTGTFAKTSGLYSVLTYTPSGGSPIADLRTLGLRQGDFISLHATAPGGQTAEWLQVLNVDSATQITCTQYPQSSGSASGLLFSLHRGAGFYTGPGRADNNCHSFMTCRSDNSAGPGFRLGGLYGARCQNLLVNVAGSYPIEVAINHLPSIGTSIHGFYTEADLNGAGGNIFCGGAAGITIDTVNGSNQPVISGEGFNWGTITNMQDSGDPGRIDPIDTATTKSYIPVMAISDLAVLRGKMFGRSYSSALNAGYTSIDLDDRDVAGAVRLLSGAEAGGGRSYDTNCIEFDTEVAVANGAVEPAWLANTLYPTLGVRRNNDGGKIYELVDTGTSAGSGGPTGTGTGIVDGGCIWNYVETGTGIAADLASKSLVRFRNNGVAKAGIGLEGELRLASEDDSGTPGDTTNHLPSGSFAMALGASTVTVTNNCVVSTSKIFLSKRDNDATATDFKVVCTLRGFTVTANASTTAAVKFDFLVVNLVNG